MFKWSRAVERGELVEPCVALVPVMVLGPEDENKDTEEVPTPAGVIHIKFSGRAIISAERGAQLS